MSDQGTGPVKRIGAFANAWWGRTIAAMLALIVANAAATANLAHGAASASGPSAIVQSLIAQATAVLQDPGASAPVRQQKLRALAKANFDFAQMARSALGYHWRSLTADQRIQFVAVFTAFIEDVYLSKLQEYGVKHARQDIQGSNINFTGESMLSPGYAEVHSTVSLASHPSPVRVDYLMVGDADAWKIYDIQVDSISVIANYRNQFNRVINERGYQVLVDSLREKAKQLSGSIGS